MEKRKAYSIALLDANAYINDSESDPLDFVSLGNHHLMINGDNIAKIARMFDISTCEISDTWYDKDGKPKTRKYYPDIEIDHDPSNMYDYSGGKVSALYVTIISANLCDIEVEYQPESGEPFADKFTYSGAFCVGWRD